MLRMAKVIFDVSVHYRPLGEWRRINSTVNCVAHSVMQTARLGRERLYIYDSAIARGV